MNFIKKYKNFFSDIVLNMIGFGIYIIAQQIILLPSLKAFGSDEAYSKLVLYLSILNVVCNVVGGELGNVRLVRDSEYKEKNIFGDFTRILSILSPIITIIVFPIFIYQGYSILGSLLFTLTILMANVRLYATCFYRLKQSYNKVIIQNVLYLIGIILSILTFRICGKIYVLLFIPELVSIFYALKNSDLLEMQFTKTKELIGTVKKFVQLGCVSFLTNVMNYFDKFLIYPIFSSEASTMYYAVNSMAKIASLITNPMSNVILSWVSNSKGEKTKYKILKATMLANIPILLGVTLITIPCTYIALFIIPPYREYIYISEATSLIIPIALTTAFGTAAALIKSVLLKFCNTSKLLIAYFIYFIVFITLGYTLSKSKGLLGFSIANLISGIVLWGSFIVLLISSKKEIKE